MLIDSIKISNYRCLKSVDLDKLSKITVLVGRNNTGKSALLEAISLASSASAAWYDALENDLLEEIVEKRGGWAHTKLMIGMSSTKANIEYKGNKSSGMVNIVKDAKELSENARSVLTRSIDRHIDEACNEEMDRMAMTKRYEAKPTDLLIRGLERKASRARREALRQAELYIADVNKASEEPETAVLFAEASEAISESDFYEFLPEEEIVRSSEPRRSSTYFSFVPSVETLKEHTRRLTVNGQLDALIRKLRKEVDYFDDIREAEDNLFVFIKKFVKPFPVESMGDGFISLLALLAAVSIAEDGIMLMEEPEMHLHPGFMALVTQHVIDTANRGKAQYVISTHSSDLVELLLKAPENLVSFIRMYRIKEKAEIDYEVLSGKEANEELKELKMDLRGP
jgi:AAA15 family ATPase/GTPase